MLKNYTSTVHTYINTNGAPIIIDAGRRISICATAEGQLLIQKEADAETCNDRPFPAETTKQEVSNEIKGNGLLSENEIEVLQAVREKFTRARFGVKDREKEEVYTQFICALYYMGATR